MLNPKKNELDHEKLNDVISLTKKILNIAYIFIIILGLYAITLLIKELAISKFIYDFLKIISPLFIGIIVAWLFDPLVTKLQQMKIKRLWGATITYLILIGGLILIIGSIIPLLSDQINVLVGKLPDVIDTIKGWIAGIIDNLGNVRNFDTAAIKSQIFTQMETFATDLSNNLPTVTVSLLTSFFSGLGSLLVGLIIGFYLLINFDGANESIIQFLPNKIKRDTNRLFKEINFSLRRYVQGILIDGGFVFAVTSILFLMAGLKAPLLFAIFISLTNVIPFIGPYIGGLPTVLFAFSQGTTIGFVTLAIVVVVQFLEGNFFQPLIMSKSTKLHPVTIMLGLLVFGHFFGIMGMVISTPIIGILKTIFIFFNKKYNIFTLNK